MINTKYNIISKRYAEALIDIAKSGKLSYQKISDDINTIKEILTQSKDLDDFLKNPVISESDKKQVIQKAFALDIDALMINFLKVLVDKNRIQAFSQIAESYKSELNKINNVSIVKVTSAVTVSDDAKNRLKQKLEEKMHKSITFDFEIDPSIIAGLVITLGDNIIDTSLKHKLDDLSKVITK